MADISVDEKYDVNNEINEIKEQKNSVLSYYKQKKIYINELKEILENMLNESEMVKSKDLKNLLVEEHSHLIPLADSSLEYIIDTDIEYQAEPFSEEGIFVINKNKKNF